jgi:Zn-dependent M16 (insulinase) family peptidase
MQARENTMTDMMQRRLQHLVYPKDSGYQNEAGGLMECLRELKIESSKGISTMYDYSDANHISNWAVREYHNQYYRPDNLVIVITGKLDQVHLMSTLEQIDKAILDRSLPFTPAVPSKRTWVPSPFIPDLEKNTIETICFPGEAETLGEIAVTWLGPQWNVRVGKENKQ